MRQSVAVGAAGCRKRHAASRCPSPGRTALLPGASGKNYNAAVELLLKFRPRVQPGCVANRVARRPSRPATIILLQKTRPMPRRNIKLTIAYDGTAYAGWQVQPGRATIQAAVQEAFFRLTGEQRLANCAGRTDAGVHALGQVANIRTLTTLPTERLLMGLNHFLPDDINIRSVVEVPIKFHATSSAKRKTYRYLIQTSRLRDPFHRRYAWRIQRSLDAAAMAVAAADLVGTHDFRGFESTGSPRQGTVRTLFAASVRREAAWNPWTADPATEPPPTVKPAQGNGTAFLVIEVTGDGFLYNMVRAIAGTLVEVGLGRRLPGVIAELLASGDRGAAGPTAPPQGLFLVGVDYGET